MPLGVAAIDGQWRPQWWWLKQWWLVVVAGAAGKRSAATRQEQRKHGVAAEWLLPVITWWLPLGVAAVDGQWRPQRWWLKRWWPVVVAGSARKQKQ